MKYRIPAVLALVVFSVAIALPRTSPNTTNPTQAAGVGTSLSFTAIDFPGAARTRARGISDSGSIVGFYGDASGVLHGYLLSQGTFTSFDPPGSIATRAKAINNLGTIGGGFLDGASVGHGFLLQHGAFTNIDFPGATSTTLEGINNRGQAVGWYIDSAGNQRSFLLSAGNFTTIDFPSAITGTIAEGINDKSCLGTVAEDTELSLSLVGTSRGGVSWLVLKRQGRHPSCPLSHLLCRAQPAPSFPRSSRW